MTNTQRVQAAIVALICLIGMKATILLWLPVLGLGFAAATGNCFSTPIIGNLLAKYGYAK
mgnify:CR=1 FL=1